MPSEVPQPLGQPVQCTTLPVRNFPLVSYCNLFSCNLWLLPPGFPVPASGKGMFCPLTPFLQRWAADSCSVCFPSASSGTFLQSCSPHLVLMNNVTRSQVQERGYYLHWTSWSLCQPSLQPEQRLCSPKHQLLFPKVHVICRHSEGATPLHPGCIIHPCATALLFCNIIWMNLFFTISCWNSSRECCSVHLTLQ